MHPFRTTSAILAISAVSMTACQSSGTAASSAPTTHETDPRPSQSTTQASNTQAPASVAPAGRAGWSSVDLAFELPGGTYDEALLHSLPSETNHGIGDRNTPNATQVTYTFDGADFDPAISADGSLVVYASTQHRPTPDIYIKRVGSSVVTQLTNDPSSDAMPALSPDGTRVAFCSDRAGNWDIYVMPISGGHAVQITTDGSSELHPSWSPDGSRLAFGRLGQISNRWEIWVVDVSNPTVSEFIGNGMFPQWCPVAGTGEAGADRILFQRSRERGDRAFGLWTIDYRDGRVGNLTQIIASPLAAFINASWSPDGARIVFASVPTPSSWGRASGTRPPKAELWMMPVAGGSRVALTSGEAVDLMPTWGPDNRIYFVSDRSGADNIWSMDLSAAILAATGFEPDTRSVITGQGVRTVTIGHDQPIANVQDEEHH